MAVMVPIKQEHLSMAQRIISFVQEQGWDIKSIEIRRYKNEYDGDVPGEDWKDNKYQWYLTLETSPKEEDEERKRSPCES